VDEAHFIKNKTSQRSQHVLALSDRIRSRTDRPLLMALTGTPLINDIEDFRAIWQFLGWIDDSKPLAELTNALEDTSLTPADRGFYPAARQCVIDLGIVRRRKLDVAADIPARRIADLPVELNGPAGRSIRAAERDLADRMMAQYDTALANRPPDDSAEGTDHGLVRRVAQSELKDTTSSQSRDNVFTIMRRIGQAKAELAADYATQLARSAGKVVFFAKHVDVMDAAEEIFARQGVRFSSIRGGQTPTARQASIDAFVNDPDVAIAVCSLTAAGVGLNLQVASNIVLAELSWTDAEQTQAIDRSHRIGQAEPVTAWRIIAAQTIDARIAGLIDSKAGLAARALDGSEEEASSPADLQLEALVALLTEALANRGAGQGYLQARCARPAATVDVIRAAHSATQGEEDAWRATGEHARHRPSRDKQGSRARRPAASGSLRRGTTRLPATEHLLREACGLRPDHDDATADAVRAGRLTHRPRGLHARPWRRHRPAGPGRTGPRGNARQRPDQGQPPRQHHAVLADQYRSVLRAPVLGEQGGLLRRQADFHSVRHQRLPR
jgi:hypothetical protein